VYPENRRPEDFFCGKPNGITFPYSSGGIHLVAAFLKLLGTKNSMIFAINHPTTFGLAARCRARIPQPAGTKNRAEETLALWPVNVVAPGQR
jgi:hypothetical protein